MQGGNKQYRVECVEDRFRWQREGSNKAVEAVPLLRVSCARPDRGESITVDSFRSNFFTFHMSKLTHGPARSSVIWMCCQELQKNG